MVRRRRRFTGGRGFLPSDLANLEAWYRFNVGITVVGAGADTWADQSGNARDLRQVTDTKRPSEESDGSLLADGVDNSMTVAFTLKQPTSIYCLGRMVTHSAAGYFWDGSFVNSGGLQTTAPSPTILMSAGGFVPTTTDLAVNTYGVVICGYDGANGSIQVNKNSATTGDVGTNDMDGFELATRGDNSSFGNIQYKEIVIYSDIKDAAAQLQVINYLSDVGGLGL